MRHELHLTAHGLLALLPVAALVTAIAAVVGGPTGAASAVVGAGLVAVNQAAAALSTGWARTLGPGVVALGYALFVVRMFAMFAALAALTQVGWLHDGLVAAAFCVSLVTALAAECWRFAKGDYAPAWRMVER